MKALTLNRETLAVLHDQEAHEAKGGEPNFSRYETACASCNSCGSCGSCSRAEYICPTKTGTLVVD